MQDYVRTARAKGVGGAVDDASCTTALRNALLPIITVVGVDFGYAARRLGGHRVRLCAGRVWVRCSISAIRMKDTPVVMGGGHVHYGGIQPG